MACSHTQSVLLGVFVLMVPVPVCHTPRLACSLSTVPRDTGSGQDRGVGPHCLLGSWSGEWSFWRSVCVAMCVCCTLSFFFCVCVTASPCRVPCCPLPRSPRLGVRQNEQHRTEADHSLAGPLQPVYKSQ